MILNRKSTKATSRISLFIAVSVIATIMIILSGNDYQMMEQITVDGVQLCKVGFVELFTALLW